jgi:hypothetical protein
MDKMNEGELAPRKSWWGRNWLWVLPTGCLGLLLSCGCLGALLFAFTFKTLSSSDVYTQALTRARQSPEVVAALGEPITAGWQVQGSLQTGTDGGSAHFSIPLKGSKAEGTLRVDALKQGGQWKYTTMRVEVPDHPRIDLLGGGEPAEPPDTTRPQDTLPQVEPLPDEPEHEPAEPNDSTPPPTHRPRHGKGQRQDKSKDDVEL